jgi:hypothetical protein
MCRSRSIRCDGFPDRAESFRIYISAPQQLIHAGHQIWVGISGLYLSVRKFDSEYGLSFDVCGRLWLWRQPDYVQPQPVKLGV